MLYMWPLLASNVNIKTLTSNLSLQKYPKTTKYSSTTILMATLQCQKNNDQKRGDFAWWVRVFYPSRFDRMVSWGLNSRSQPSARKALGSGSKTHTTVSHQC